MSEKHSPGPWVAVFHPGEWQIRADDCSCGINGYLAGCVTGSPESRANAHLIAAAPDLLEVVKAFVAETIDYATLNKLGDAEQQHNVKWARAVIAKIEGRS